MAPKGKKEGGVSVVKINQPWAGFRKEGPVVNVIDVSAIVKDPAMKKEKKSLGKRTIIKREAYERGR